MKTANQLGAGFCLTSLLLFATAQSFAAALPGLQLRITEPTPANEFTRHPELEWNGTSGAIYRVQSTTKLADPGSWGTVEAVYSESFPVRWQGPELDAVSRYYRLQGQPEILGLEPAFIDASDSNAVLYVFGQLLPTDATVIINGQSFTPTVINSNGVWATVSLNGLPPGTLLTGTITVIDNATASTNIEYKLQSGFIYATSPSAAMLQGPPEEPPASPLVAGLNINPLFTGGGGIRNNALFEQDSLMSVVSRGLPVPSPKTRVDSWAAIVERTTAGGGGPKDDDGDGGAASINSQGNRGAVIQFDVVNAKNPVLSSVSGGAVFPGAPEKCGDGICQATGEIRCQETDLAIPGVGLNLAWTRTYRSRTGPTTAQGAGWDFSYNVRLTAQSDGTMLLRPGNGREDTFYPNATGGWTRDEYFCEIHELDVDADGLPDLLEIVFSEGSKWLFNPFDPFNPSGGKLSQIVDHNGNTITLNYDGAGRLETIVDDLDRTNTVAYNSIGLIASVTDFSGRTVRYEYDGNGDLVAVVSPAVIGTPTGNDFPGGITNRYTYSSGFPFALDRLNHNLTTCIDGKGQTWLQVFYQPTNNPASIDFDAVAYTLRGIEKKDIRRYGQTPTPTNGFATTKVIVRDAVGNVSESFYDSRQRCVRLLEYTGRAPNLTAPTTETLNRPVNKLRADDPDTYETKWTWNPDSLCTHETRAMGDRTRFIYERDFSSSASPRKKGDCRVVREYASSPVDTDGDGVADTSELAWHFDYDPRFGSPAGVSSLALFKARNAANFNPIMFSARHAINTKGTGAQGGRGVLARKVNQTAGEQCDNGVCGNGIKDIQVGEVCDDGNTISGDGCNTDFVISVTNPRGIVTTAGYDAKGNSTNLLQELRGLALEVTLDYTAQGQPNAITNAADGNGYRRVDTFSYHSSGPQAGYLASVTIDEFGAHLTTSYEYDARGNVTRIVNPSGHDTLYTWNALNQLVRHESPTNITARCATDLIYDANGNVVQRLAELRDENDALVQLVVTRGTFDLLDRTLTVEDQVSAGQFVTNRFSYGGDGGVILIESPLAVSGVDPHNAVAFEHDERGLLFREIGAPGSGISLTNEHRYDGNRRFIGHHQNALFNGACSYDGFSRPATITDAMSNTVTYAYDRNNNLILKRVSGELNDGTGSAGNVRLSEQRWKYDYLDRCIESRALFFNPATQAPIGDGSSVTAFAYAPNGQCTNITDDLGRMTRFGYDKVGRHISTTDARGNFQIAVRDMFGNPTSTASIELSDLGGPPQVFSRTNVYDNWNRCVSTTDNRGNNINWRFGSDSTLLRSVDARGAITRHEYDLRGRPTKTFQDMNDNDIVEAVDVVTTQTWDDNSRLVSVTDDNTNTTYHAYDSRNRPVQITSADGTARNLVWSPRSNLILEQDANGTVISNSFDLLDRCIRRDITPGPGVAGTTTFEIFAYSGLSQLVAATNNASFTVQLQDSFGNLVSSMQDGRVTTYTHDGVGNCLSMTYPSGRVVIYTYNALNEVTNVSSSANSALPPVTLASYKYAGPGRVGEITRTNGVNTHITWNGLVSPPNNADDFGVGQVSRVNHQVAGGGAVIDSRIAAFDRNQNRILRAQTAAFFVGGDMTTNTWTHNPLDQVIASTLFRDNSLASQSYALDGNGNRQLVISNGIAQPYFMDPTPLPGPADFQVDQYTMTPFASQTHDENGNRLTRVSTAAQLMYEYDYADRLVSVVDVITGSAEPVASFSYNVLGQRISKTSYPPAPSLPVTTEFVYGGLEDCNNRIIEVRSFGVVGEVFVLDGTRSQDDGVVARFTAGGQPQYYHSDDLGNVLALTDDLGAVIGRNDYSAFGEPIFLTSDGFPIATNASPTGNPFLFRGMEWDAETGLYHTSGNRDYPFEQPFGNELGLAMGVNPLYGGAEFANNPLYGAGFSRSGGGRYFDPQIASAIRGKVKAIKIDSIPLTFTLNPWSFEHGNPDRPIVLGSEWQNASAIRGKVKVVKVESLPTTFTLNPYRLDFTEKSTWSSKTKIRVKEWNASHPILMK